MVGNSDELVGQLKDAVRVELADRNNMFEDVEDVLDAIAKRWQPILGAHESPKVSHKELAAWLRGLPHVRLSGAKTARNFIYLSGAAGRAYGLRPKDGVALYYDHGKRLIGLKVVDDTAPLAYKLVQSGRGYGLRLSFGMFRRVSHIDDEGSYELKKEGDMFVFDLTKPLGSINE